MNRLEEILNSLPAYVYHDNEKNRLYLMITRDVRGHWNMCYETEGRCYYAATGRKLEGDKGCVELLKILLDRGIDTTEPIETRDSNEK